MGVGVVQACTLECLSTSALLPCAETGTLWERAGSGSLYTQGMEGELRKQTTQKHNGFVKLMLKEAKVKPLLLS